MKRVWSFFHGLRGRLTLTYTLVTVLALLALEIFILAAGVLISGLTQSDKRAYLSDVVNLLGSKASQYVEPGKEDLPGLQTWLEGVHKSGYASLAPMNAFDSPAAPIVQSKPMLVLAPDGKILAQSPAPKPGQSRPADLLDSPAAQRILKRAFAGHYDSLGLVTTDANGNYLLAVPVPQPGESAQASDVAAVILLTVRPSPPMLLQIWPTLLGWVLITAVLLLMAVAPFGALFGFIMSRGLTRRLALLSHAVDVWSEGDFRPQPYDRSNDEIGHLSTRMRNMAERLQALLHTQQQLAMIEERNRLARELHDTVKQQAFATLMQVRAARNVLESDPAAARQRLEEAENLIKTSQQDLGRMIAELRPAALEGQGLPGALREYLNTWSKYTRIPATLNVQNERSLPLEIEQALYRVTQEALANIARHSSASSVTLRLVYEPNEVCLSAADNGVGFDPSLPHTSGYGLQTMRERLGEVAGRLVIESAPGQGTRVTATAPAKGLKG